MDKPLAQLLLPASLAVASGVLVTTNWIDEGIARALFIFSTLVFLAIAARLWRARNDRPRQSTPWIRAGNNTKADIAGVRTFGYDGAEFGSDSEIRGRNWEHHADATKRPSDVGSDAVDGTTKPSRDQGA
jgi:hypothetical protein